MKHLTCHDLAVPTWPSESIKAHRHAGTCFPFTWRGQQIVDVDGFRAAGSSEQLLLQSLPQSRVGLDAPLQLKPQVSDL